LPDGVALLKVLEQPGELRGGGRAEGMGGDINEEANFLMGGVGAGSTRTQLKCLHTKYSTVCNNITVEVRWVHCNRHTDAICMRWRECGQEIK